MNSIRKQTLLAAGAAAVALSAAPAYAQDASETSPLASVLEPPPAKSTYLDLTGSLGWSSNPFVQTVDSESSFLGRASARGVHAWRGERSASSISAFVEGTTYFSNYGLESIFAVNGDTSYDVSETVTVYGSASVTGDLSGQLSNRFLFVPPVPPIPNPNVPPPPPTVENPDVFDFAGRSYHIFGQGGASIQTGTRSNVGITAGVSRAIYDAPQLDEYTSVFATGSYNVTLSERTSVGGMLSVTRTGYDNSSNHSTTINPAATINTRLSEAWSARATVGVTFSKVDRQLTEDSSVNLSLNGSICRTTESERLCGRVDRYSASSANSTLITTTSAGVDWYKKLDDVQTVQLSATASHYVDEVLNLERKTNHFSLLASYSRMINERLSGGVDLGARSLHRDDLDADTDITGTVFVRYRIGDLG